MFYFLLVHSKLSRTGLTRPTLRWITLSTAGGKEGKKAVLPSFLLAKERVDERSKVGVSKIFGRQFKLQPFSICLCYYQDGIPLMDYWAKCSPVNTPKESDLYNFN